MTDITVAIASFEMALLDVANQASALAIGLQNAAPGDKSNSPNRSVQYLFAIAECLVELSGKSKTLLLDEISAQHTKLNELAREAAQRDKEAREQFQIGDKFRFIRDRLNALLVNVDEMLAETQKITTQVAAPMADDEVLVYVYLFNAQGILLPTWQKMIGESVFYEHSVNRPIYTEKTHVDAFINRKATKTQHAYLTIAIKKQDISKAEGTESLKDVYDNPLIKVREGSLLFNKLVAFTHNGQDYIVDKNGVLVKKV